MRLASLPLDTHIHTQVSSLGQRALTTVNLHQQTATAIMTNSVSLNSSLTLGRRKCRHHTPSHLGSLTICFVSLSASCLLPLGHQTDTRRGNSGTRPQDICVCECVCLFPVLPDIINMINGTKAQEGSHGEHEETKEQSFYRCLRQDKSLPPLTFEATQVTTSRSLSYIRQVKWKMKKFRDGNYDTEYKLSQALIYVTCMLLLLFSFSLSLSPFLFFSFSLFHPILPESLASSSRRIRAERVKTYKWYYHVPQFKFNWV